MKMNQSANSYHIPGTTENSAIASEHYHMLGNNSKHHYLRGTLVNRTYGGHKNLYNLLFLPTIFGPIYYSPS